MAGKDLTLATGRPMEIAVGFGEYSLNVASFFIPAGGRDQPLHPGTLLPINLPAAGSTTDMAESSGMACISMVLSLAISF
jgi:hypothetical protein